MKTAADRLIGQMVEKVRILMGETGKNRALRMTDLIPGGEIAKLAGRGTSGTGTGPATTDDLPEGQNNLYLTGQRVAAAAPVKTVAGERGDITAEKLKEALSLGSAAGANIERFATADQGQLAESALQDPAGGMPPGIPFVRVDNDWAQLEVGPGLSLTATEGTSDDGGKILLEVTATGGAVPYYVPEDTVYLVPDHMQALFTLPIELAEGASIELDGALVEVN